VESAEFRRILGHWTTGVAVVATMNPAGQPRGLTASAITSVSLAPPLVLACVERVADTHEFIRSNGWYSISILPQTAERIARRFAAEAAELKFEGVAFRVGTTGAPILEDAIAWIECTVRSSHDGGDHTIFVGEVVAGDAREGEPLVYYRGGFHRLVP
jgi:flavin reductase (DIM6/NTAB) family NADH-FMN oxidoreductase RutF